MSNSKTSEVNKYFAYARISGGKEQKNRNLSIPSQVDQINNYVKSKGAIRVDKTFKEIHSAFRGKRPVFHQMLKELKQRNDIKGVIVFKWDRVSRNVEDYVRIQNIRGSVSPIDIISVTEPMIGSYLGRYMIRDLQNRSILYSEELSFRVRLGQRKKLQMGGYVYAAPFGFKTINGYLTEDPDKQKADIVKYAFQRYATGLVGFRDLAKDIKKKFKLEDFYWKKVEYIIKSSLYYGVCTKKWVLSNEEYMFFGAEEPGIFIEQYKIKNITPLISKELYEQCQHVRKNLNPYTRRKTGVAKFPKIYECSCGRKLRRYNRKGHRYLCCPKEINGVHTEPCSERHTPLHMIQGTLEKLIRGLIPPEGIRTQMVAKIEQEIAENSQEKNIKLADNTRKIMDLQNKLKELTENYTDGIIGNEVFTFSSEKISADIKLLKDEIRFFEDYNLYSQAQRKVIRFVEILASREETLDKLQNNKKSSRVFANSFKVAGNSIICDRNISSYRVKQPFSFFELRDFSKWWGIPAAFGTT